MSLAPSHPMSPMTPTSPNDDGKMTHDPYREGMPTLMSPPEGECLKSPSWQALNSGILSPQQPPVLLSPPQGQLSPANQDLQSAHIPPFQLMPPPAQNGLHGNSPNDLSLMPPSPMPQAAFGLNNMNGMQQPATPSVPPILLSPTSGPITSPPRSPIGALANVRTGSTLQLGPPATPTSPTNHNLSSIPNHLYMPTSPTHDSLPVSPSHSAAGDFRGFGSGTNTPHLTSPTSHALPPPCTPLPLPVSINLKNKSPQQQPQQQQHLTLSPTASPTHSNDASPKNRKARSFPSKGGRKLFVGQLHKTTQVEDLRQLMMQYGQLEDLHIIYDKATGMGTGAAFVVYKEPTAATAAVRALHGRHKIEGMSTCMQVRLAEGEVDADKDVKLFVGQVPPTASERDLEQIFDRFGNLLEVAILRKDGKSRGCAFVRYGSRESADAAINSLNGKTTLPGGLGPITVRLANTEADKRRKKDEKEALMPGTAGHMDPNADKMKMPGGMSPPQQQHMLQHPQLQQQQQMQLQQQQQQQQQLQQLQQQQQMQQQQMQQQQMQHPQLQQQQQQQQQMKASMKLKQPLFVTPGMGGVPMLSSPQNHQQQQQQQQQQHQQQLPQQAPNLQQQQQLNQFLGPMAQLPAGWAPQLSPINSDHGSSTSGAGSPHQQLGNIPAFYPQHQALESQSQYQPY